MYIYRVSNVYLSYIFRVCIEIYSGLQAAKVLLFFDICKLFPRKMFPIRKIYFFKMFPERKIFLCKMFPVRIFSILSILLFSFPHVRVSNKVFVSLTDLVY